MDYDLEKIDEAVLAILYLSAFEEDGHTRAWKSINWEATDRLFDGGLISYPKTLSKSLVFTTEGFERAREAAHRLFQVDRPAQSIDATRTVAAEMRSPDDLYRLKA